LNLTPEKRLAIKIVSHLLDYPDEAWLASLEPLRQMVTEIGYDPDREALAGFLLHLQNLKLLSLQEEYSRLFDLASATCLNLTYHKYGDHKGRGAALAQLHQLYHSAGYETMTGELPDFLPVVLEFLTVCPDEASAWVCGEYGSQIETLAARLKETGTPYADLLSVIAGAFRN
jgi:nitrate reductase molybdenum cofactor assembly chaperone NarJ/NarW